MAYKALILLPSDTDASIDGARRVLEDFYADDAGDVAFETSENRLTVTIDDWNCRIALNSRPSVLEESQEMASHFPDRADKDQIASSGVRFEVTTDDDAEMDFFNDYILIIEKLGEFKGAKIWEDAQGDFIN